jgi:hypothetical protein
VLKNSFDLFSAQNLICKLLNFGSAGRRKVADITALVPFSTATGDYTHNPVMSEMAIFHQRGWRSI